MESPEFLLNPTQCYISDSIILVFPTKKAENLEEKYGT
jgi:hypothetical protein